MLIDQYWERAEGWELVVLRADCCLVQREREEVQIVRSFCLLLFFDWERCWTGSVCWGQTLVRDCAVQVFVLRFVSRSLCWQGDLCVLCLEDHRRGWGIDQGFLIDVMLSLLEVKHQSCRCLLSTCTARVMWQYCRRVVSSVDTRQ